MSEGGRAGAGLVASADSLLKQVCQEPSAGLHYIQDHVQRTVPLVVASKGKVKSAGDALAATKVDADFCLESLRQINQEGPDILASMMRRLNNARYSMDEIARGGARGRAGGTRGVGVGGQG